MLKRLFRRLFPARKVWTAEERRRAHMFILGAAAGPALKTQADGKLHVKAGEPPHEEQKD